MRLHETLLGLVVMALAAAVFAFTFTFPDFPGQRHGPALFPRLLCAGIALCGAVIAWRGRGSNQRWLALDESLATPRARWSFVLLPLAVVGYWLLADRLGFLPTAALLVGLLGAWFGLKAWQALLSGVLTALIVQWFFGSLMRVPLPRGLFMQWWTGT